MYHFAITNGFNAPAVMASEDLFRATIERRDVRDRCAQIAAYVRLARESKDPTVINKNIDAASALKRQLPAICWHAWYDDNRRLQKNAHDSGLVMLDIDHIDNPKKVFDSLSQLARSYGLVAAHITPSTLGLRLVFRRPDGLPIPEAQHYLASALNLSNVDTCVKDLSRLSFIVPADYWFFIDYNALFHDEPAATPHPTPEPQPTANTPQPTAEPHPTAEPQPMDNTPQPTAKNYPENYGELPYSDIISELVTLMGGAPKQGNRNNFIFRLAGILRYICDDDPLWIESVMPDFGEEVAKLRQTIRSSLKAEQIRSMPKVLNVAMEKVRSKLLRDSAIEPNVQDAFAATPPPMPKVLPPLIKHLVKNVPGVCQPAVANAVFPALAAHLFGVSFRLIDGTYKEPSFMCVNIAKQSSGKASVNAPISFIIDDILKRDAINRQREQDWKDEVTKKASNKEKPKRPDDLCVQCLVSDMTNAAFVQRLKDANGHYLYTNLEELELLRQLQTNGMHDVGKIICLCYDNGIYGQERVGFQSVTANVPVRWNWNASTTVRKGQDFFANRLVDGTLSRINFCTIFRDRTQPFLYKEYDDNYAAVLKPFITKLNLASGRYVCSQALTLARNLLNECLNRSALADDEIYEQLAYRAVTIAYMKSMVLYIANDCTWDKSIAQFTEWSLFYDLFVKMYYFGDQIQSEDERENVKAKPRCNSILPLLPDVFTREQADTVRMQMGKSKNGTGNMLRVWIFRNFITFDPVSQTYSKVK